MSHPTLPSARRARALSLLAVGLGLAGAHACLPADEGCRRSRSCFPEGGAPGGGAPGSVDTFAGSGSLRQEAAAGAAGDPGLGGTAGAEAEVELPKEGTECSPNGLYACAGHATRLQLVCVHGVFERYSDCPDGELCDTRTETSGLCQPVVPECVDQLPGDVVCRGAQRLICGADLVTASELDTCPSICFAGKCVECLPDAPPSCDPNSNTRRSCTAEGAWDVASCPTVAPHCSGGSCGSPPSCLELDPVCGHDGDEPCCPSPIVPEGLFDDLAEPRIMTSFRLDRFEVTVGRFRAFRAAWDLGWRPEVGSGKHVHLNGGLGLPLLGGYETGWQASYLEGTNPSDETQAPTNPGTYPTWSEAAGDDELRPINFVNFYEAAAFCIWDGGFLPTNSEHRYAARGGSAMRPYPWGATEPGPDFDLAIYGCLFPEAGALSCQGRENIAPVGTALGEGLYGQLDLSGNLAEWVLPGSPPGCAIEHPTEFCAIWPAAPGLQTGPVPVRGGAFDDDVSLLSNTAADTASSHSAREDRLGFRCARAP